MTTQPASLTNLTSATTYLYINELLRFTVSRNVSISIVCIDIVKQNLRFTDAPDVLAWPIELGSDISLDRPCFGASIVFHLV